MTKDIEVLLKVAYEMQKKIKENDISFLFLGSGAQKNKLESQAKQMGLRNTVFLASVPKADVLKYWGVLDLAVIHLKKKKLFETVIPSKIFECMAMGVPIVHGVMGESAEMVKSLGVGICVEPENVDEILETILYLRENPDLMKELSRKGPIAAVKFDRKKLAMTMLSKLEGICGTI